MLPRKPYLYLALVLCLQIQPFSQSTAWAQFYTPPIFAKGHQPTALAGGDLNNDTKVDLVGLTTNNGVPAVMALLGNGVGGFKAPIFTSLSGVSSPNLKYMVLADFNHDSKLDVAVPARNSVTGVGEVAVLLGNGNGTFQSPLHFAACACQFAPFPIVTADITGHGESDLVLGNTPLSALLSNGDGTFAAPVFTNVPVHFSASALQAGDFNHDGKADLAITNGFMLGNGDGTFQAPQTLANGNGVFSVAVADFDGGGNLDIAASFSGSFLAILSGNGDGSFQAASSPFGDGHVGIAPFLVGDFNGDGKPDLAALSSNMGFVVLLNGGNGTFQKFTDYAGGLSALVAGDFNGDHHLDLAAPNAGGVSVFLNRGDGTFPNGLNGVGLNTGNLRVADFDNDGKPDLLETGGSFNGILLGKGDGTFKQVPLPQPANCGQVPPYGETALGTFNADPKPDLAVVVPTSPTLGICVLLASGGGAFAASGTLFDSGVPHQHIRAADFNKDGELDLVASDTGGISILLGNGDGSFQSGIPTALGQKPDFIVGDFNHDSKLDVAAIINGTQLTVLLGKGDGTFKAPVTTIVPSGMLIGAAADLNKDTKLDLVTLTSDGINVLLGNGDGTFKPRVKYSAGPRIPLSAVIRDFTGDGNLDVVTANNGGGFITLFPGNGNGTFRPAKLFHAGGTNSTIIQAADFNGDKKIDIVVVNKGSRNFVVLLNTNP